MKSAPKETLLFDGVRVVETTRRNRTLDTQELKANIRRSGYGASNGVYVLARSNKGVVAPDYVGRTIHQTFEQECGSDHARSKYLDALVKGTGRQLLFLLKPARSGNGRNSHKAIADYEKKMIAAAHLANPQLLNRYLVPLKPVAPIQISVRTRRGQSKKDEAVLRRMLNCR